MDLRRGSNVGSQEKVDLRICQNGAEVAKIELSSSPVIFGGAADCDVCLEDATVAPRHLRLFQSGGDVFAENLGGAGTSVNGSPAVGVVRLNSGDRLWIGAYTFEVRFSGRVDAAPGPSRATAGIRVWPWAFAAAAVASAIVVVVVSFGGGESQARQHELPTPAKGDASSVRIGNLDLSPADMYSRATAAYGAGQYEEAVALCRKAAEMGQHDAENLLGVMCGEGLGLPKNQTEEVIWYRKAAEAGHSNAMFNLGVAYALGRGSQKDVAQAANWYEKAAVNGHSGAQFNLALLYIEGDGVPKDVAKGLRLLQSICGKLPAAANKLGEVYYYGKGVDQDLVKAAECFRAGAERGDAKAQFCLSVLYENGEGVEQDVEAADKWLRSAAALGYEAAVKALKDPAWAFRKASLAETDVRAFLDGYCEAWCKLIRRSSSDDDQSGYTLLDPVSMYCTKMRVSPWEPAFGINDFEVLNVVEVVNESRRELGYTQSFEFTLRVHMMANNGATMGTRRVPGRLDWAAKQRMGVLLVNE